MNQEQHEESAEKESDKVVTCNYNLHQSRKIQEINEDILDKSIEDALETQLAQQLDAALGFRDHSVYRANTYAKLRQEILRRNCLLEQVTSK